MTKKLSIILASFAMIGYVGCTDFPGFPILPDDGNPGGGGVVDPTDSIPDRDPWGGGNGHGDTIIIDGDTIIVDDHGNGGGRDDCDTIVIDDPTDDNGGHHGGRGGRGGRGGHGGGLDDGDGDDNGGDTLRTDG